MIVEAGRVVIDKGVVEVSDFSFEGCKDSGEAFQEAVKWAIGRLEETARKAMD